MGVFRKMALTDTEIRRAKPGDKAYKLSDRDGLFLLVTPSGGQLWRWKYRYSGKEKLMALGRYPEISLADARDRCVDARKQLARGIDPMRERQASKAIERRAEESSFEAVAWKWFEHWRSGKSERHVGYVKRRLEADILQAIGDRPLADVEAPELVELAQSIQARGAIDVAKRVLETTNQIFRYAIAHGLAKRNPATDFKPGDVLQSRRTINYARVDAKELPALLRAVEMYQGTPVTRLALKLMTLTFLRTAELTGGRWEEIDIEARRWNLPPSRMKMRAAHIVPLSSQAIEVLELLRTATGATELLFPGDRDNGKPMHNNTILRALEILGYKGRQTGHGFRGIASTILHERGFEHVDIELQLAHAPQSAVSASYNHALRLEPRAKMMQWWGDYLDESRKGKLLPFTRQGVA